MRIGEIVLVTRSFEVKCRSSFGGKIVQRTQALVDYWVYWLDLQLLCHTEKQKEWGMKIKDANCHTG